MPVVWNFRKWLAVNKDIYRPSQLQELIAQKAGVYISVQTLSGLMNDAPEGMRFKTMQIICNVLECDICDFFNIQHETIKERSNRKKAVGEELPPLYGKRSPKQSPKKQDNDEDIYPEFGLLSEPDEHGEM